MDHCVTSDTSDSLCLPFSLASDWLGKHLPPGVAKSTGELAQAQEARGTRPGVVSVSQALLSFLLSVCSDFSHENLRRQNFAFCLGRGRNRIGVVSRLSQSPRPCS